MIEALLLSGALFSTLDPKSLSETVAFYELYSDSEEGKDALKRASSLLDVASSEQILFLTSHINRLKNRTAELTEEEITKIETLASHLANRRLKGYRAKNEEEVLQLDSEEIDLGKALILSQLRASEDAEMRARRYSALLDLMALQILARLPKDATPFEKIQETNRFIFEQMHFKFPPQSLFTENIDRYTFLPSVMDDHLGVCLGVTAMYLAVAQRLELPLEIITPPGHIYIRYRDEDNTINIETTARGIHLPDETYLSVQNSTLELRTLKEVIGMTHFNNASTYLYKAEYTKASVAYEKALPYMSADPLVKELLGLSYLFTDQKERGEALLQEVTSDVRGIAEDYLAKKVDLEGIETVFMHVNGSRDSILKKQKRLEDVVNKYPEFRDGLHQLAITWIQLNRWREAIDIFLRSYYLDPNNPLTSYYLAVLYGQRQDFRNAWQFLKKAEELTVKENFHPKSLRDLRRLLCQHCPE